MRTKTKHKINAVAPRLSDEDPDPIEQDDTPDGYHLLQDGWMPWDAQDVNDIKKLINKHLPPKQRYVLLCFLDGLSYSEAGLSEKHWRYHFTKGIEFIKKELKL